MRLTPCPVAAQIPRRHSLSQRKLQRLIGHAGWAMGKSGRDQRDDDYGQKGQSLH